MSVNDIKVTGEPLTYGDGAIRNTKEGKGRFDLIPSEVFRSLCGYYSMYKPFDRDKFETIADISNGCWESAIIRLTELGYSEHGCGFEHLVWPMLKDLAVHFQKGAEIYGERNCQKGIPLWSFKDSAMRHTTQYFNGERDEPHLISAIWNLWLYGWTVLTQENKE